MGSLLGSLKSLHQMPRSRFRIRIADAPGAPESLQSNIEYFSRKRSESRCKRLEMDFGPTIPGGTQIESKFKIYSAFLTYAQAFERCKAFRADMDPFICHSNYRKLDESEAFEKLQDWFMSHLQHPYPTEDEKRDLMRQTGLQISMTIQQ